MDGNAFSSDFLRLWRVDVFAQNVLLMLLRAGFGTDDAISKSTMKAYNGGSLIRKEILDGAVVYVSNNQENHYTLIARLRQLLVSRKSVDHFSCDKNSKGKS